MNDLDHTDTVMPGSSESSVTSFHEEESISLIDILLEIAKNHRLISVTTGIFTLVALVIAIASPNTYSASVRMISESGNSQSNLTGGLAALSRYGINIGGSVDGITVDTYPDILMSKEVLLAVAKSSYVVPGQDSLSTLVYYFNQPPGLVGSALAALKTVTIGLPKLIMKSINEPQLMSPVLINQNDYYYLTEEEENVITILKANVSIGVDRVTKILTLNVLSEDAMLSAQIAQTFIDKLMDRVSSIYTHKSIEHLTFVQERFKESQLLLREAEENLIDYVEHNRISQSARLKIEYERLQRQVNFKTEMYSNFQAQLTQAEIDLQRTKPIITIVEAPIPPLEKSGPKRKLIVFIGIFAGLAWSLGMILIQDSLDTKNADEHTKAKMLQIRTAASSSWLWSITRPVARLRSKILSRMGKSKSGTSM